MSIERMVRIWAGFVILVSLVLYHYHSPNWLYLTAFAGLNLLQSGITKFCPAAIILEKITGKKTTM